MTHLKYLLLFVGLAILASCDKSDAEGEISAINNKATFSGTIGEYKTRATEDAWDEGDAIGIFALISGSNPTAVYESKFNCQYVTTGNGKFIPVDVSGIINFPKDGKLDFVAYYPWQKEISDLEYTIVAGTDPLYSENAKSKNNDNSNIDLVFNHMLSKIVLEIEVGENLTSLEGLSASVNNVIVDGRLNLASGTVTLGEAKHEVVPNVNIENENKLATINTLVMPTQDLKNVEVVFSLGENSYSWSPKTTMVLASNKKYTYKLKLNIETEPYVVEVGTAIINGWEEGHTDTDFEILEPDKTPNPLEFSSDVTELKFKSDGQQSKIIKLTAEKSQAWTITKTVDWITLNPEADGIGDKDISVTATENSESTERKATITITPIGNESITPIIITISQSGKSLQEGGDGTFDRPFTVAEAFAEVWDSKKHVWVRAFIVGTDKSGLSLKGAVETNLLIADNKEESNVSNAMAAELPVGLVRNYLNLKKNPEMYKAEVLLYGTLEYYFSGSGLKNVKDYKVISTNK